MKTSHSMRKHTPVVFLFNSPIDSGCDYVVQTMRVVARTHAVYGLALGDIISLPKLLVSRERWVTRRVQGLAVVRPVSLFPGIRFRVVRQITYGIWSMIIRISLALTYPYRNKMVWFFEPFHMTALMRIFSGYTSIYDCVDYYPGFSENAAREHAQCVRLAGLVVANSEPLASKLRKQRGDVVVVPLGFAADLFASCRVVPVLPGKIPFVVGFIGSISSRIDFPLLVALVRKLVSVQFLFVGPLERDVFGKADTAAEYLNTLRRFPNVTWVPRISKFAISETLSRIDVGLIPYRDDLEFNRYSFPMKVLEYFAAGRPVISTAIESLVPYSKQGFVYVGKSAEEMARVTRRLSKSGWSFQQQQRQHDIALSHTWEQKVTKILMKVAADRKS